MILETSEIMGSRELSVQMQTVNAHFYFFLFFHFSVYLSHVVSYLLIAGSGNTTVGIVINHWSAVARGSSVVRSGTRAR